MPKPTRNAKSKNRGKMQDEDTVDCSRISSSSISSSDSEAGLITNDEDREGTVNSRASYTKIYRVFHTNRRILK